MAISESCEACGKEYRVKEELVMSVAFAITMLTLGI